MFKIRWRKSQGSETKIGRNPDPASQLERPVRSSSYKLINRLSDNDAHPQPFSLQKQSSNASQKLSGQDSFWNMLYYAYDQIHEPVIIIELQPDKPYKRICYTNQSALEFLSGSRPIRLRGRAINEFMREDSSVIYDDYIKNWRSAKTSKNTVFENREQCELIMNNYRVTASLTFLAEKGKVANIFLITQRTALSAEEDHVQSPPFWLRLLSMGSCCGYSQSSCQVLPAPLEEEILDEEQKQTHSELFWNKMFYAYNQLREPVIIIELKPEQSQKCILYANQRAQDFFDGYNADYHPRTMPEGLRGRSITAFMPPDSQAEYDDVVSDWEESRQFNTGNRSSSKRYQYNRKKQYVFILNEQIVTASLSFSKIEDKIVNIILIKESQPSLQLEVQYSPHRKEPRVIPLGWVDTEAGCHHAGYDEQRSSIRRSHNYDYPLYGAETSAQFDLLEYEDSTKRSFSYQT